MGAPMGCELIGPLPPRTRPLPMGAAADRLSGASNPPLPPPPPPIPRGLHSSLFSST